jgi:hypothetical protein
MRNILIIAAATIALATPALAQSGTVTGAAGGAATGAVLGGPAGAVVGGVAGAVVGSTLSPPPAEVRTYVIQESVPSVRYRRKLVVGEPLERTVEVRQIPKYDNYSYAVVNDRRVIVDRKTRRIVEVVE